MQSVNKSLMNSLDYTLLPNVPTTEPTFNHHPYTNADHDINTKPYDNPDYIYALY
jgi:hypothetical protein